MEDEEPFYNFANYLSTAPQVTELILTYLHASDVARCLRTCKLLRHIILSAVSNHGKLTRYLQCGVSRDACINGNWSTKILPNLFKEYMTEAPGWRESPYYATCHGHWIVLMFVTDSHHYYDRALTMFFENYVSGKRVKLDVATGFCNFRHARSDEFLVFGARSVDRIVVPIDDCQMPKMERLYEYTRGDMEFHRMLRDDLLRDVMINHLCATTDRHGQLNAIVTKFDDDLKPARIEVMKLDGGLLPLRIVKSQV